MVQILKENATQGYMVTKLDATDKFDALQQMSGVLVEKGWVKESYVEAIQEREKVFPTGLPMETIGIAIPHTDCIHVNTKCIMVGILEKPVEFVVMATDDDVCEVEVMFMLGIMKPHDQLEMLSMLIDTCQNAETISTIKAGTDMEKITEIMDALMP